MGTLVPQSLITIALKARQNDLITDEVCQAVCDPNAKREEYFIGRILEEIKVAIGGNREKFELFIEKVLKPVGGFLDDIVQSMEGKSCYCNT